MLGKLKRLLQKGPFYRLYLRWCKRLRFWVQDVQYPRLYCRAAKRPVDESKVLFLECSRRTLSNSFGVLFHQLEARGGLSLRCHYLLHTTASRRMQRKRCRAFVRDLATAKVLFLDEATDILSHVDMRPETQVVQL
jgi:CDP-ribitol ribitolphosphotransferase